MSEVPEDIQRILQWPAETWSPQEEHRLLEFRAALHGEMRKLVEGAERFDRNLTADEEAKFDWLKRQFDELADRSRKSTPDRKEVAHEAR